MSQKTQKKNWKSALKSRKWGEHKHCNICGISIPSDEDFCSEECRGKYFKTENSKQSKNKFCMIGTVVVMIVMFVIMGSFGG